MIRDIRALTFDLDNTLWETDISILNAEAVMASHLRNLAPEAWMADFTLENFRKIRALVVTNHSIIFRRFAGKHLPYGFNQKELKYPNPKIWLMRGSVHFIERGKTSLPMQMQKAHSRLLQENIRLVRSQTATLMSWKCHWDAFSNSLYKHRNSLRRSHIQ
jgi:hypothetical protein